VAFGKFALIQVGLLAAAFSVGGDCLLAPLNYRWPGGSGRAGGAELSNETGLLPTVLVLGFSNSCAGLQMASSALSHNTSGLRSPVLARAMSLSAMVLLT